MRDNTQEINIICVDGNTKGTLRLDQTILIFQNKAGGCKSRWLIPIGLITISTNKRLHGYLLVKGLLSFLSSVIILVLYGVISSHSGFFQNNSLTQYDKIIMPTILGIGLILFFLYLWQFITDRETVVLNIEDAEEGHCSLEFWCHKKRSRHIESFIDLLENQKQKVERDLSRTIEHSIPTGSIYHFRRLLCFLFISFTPAMGFEKLWMLWFGVVPVVFWMRSTLSLLMQPRPYRRAMTFAQKERWDKVEEQVLLLDDQLQICIPMTRVQLDMYLMTDRFDHALKFIGNLPEEYHEDTQGIQEIQKYIWLMKRIRSRMSGGL